jgi:hypothetical protein
MPRFALLGIFLFTLPFDSGCLYCAYPALDYTPPLKLDTAPDEIHAFRVDATSRRVVPLGGFINVPEDQLWKPDEQVLSQQLSELSTSPTHEVPAQIKPSLSYGFLIPILVANALTHTSRSVSVRLYRPGYELVEVHAWENVTRIAWNPVADVEGQERTLDNLVTWPLEAGSASGAHRQALLFAASEYDRLAAGAPSARLRVRLAGKARTLRDQAEK